MLTMFIRALILYILVIALMRIMGKRQIGQLQPFELVFTIIIADLVASPMSDVGIPLFYGVLPIAALVLVYSLLSILSLKSERARELITGRPSILVRNGVINQKEMRRQGYTISDLLEQVRESGLQNLHEVGCAVLEISGQVNVFPVSQKRSVTTQDLQIATGYEGLPIHLVLDGRIQSDSLRLAGLDEAWLFKQLKSFGTAPKNVYFCALDTSGLLCVQRRDENDLQYRTVLKPEEVKW